MFFCGASLVGFSLKVSTEVSELTNQGAYQGASQTGIDSDGNLIPLAGITIPALSVRRAESVIELPGRDFTRFRALAARAN